MPITESAKKYHFGNIEPQQLRDYSGPGNTLLYEGFSVQGTPQASPGWVILKHIFDGNNMDKGTSMLVGKSYSIRSSYTFPPLT
jgi:hypothetical protein